MSSPRLDRVMLTVRTLRHMHPEQVAHRVRLRGQRAVLARLPDALLSSPRRTSAAHGWPAGFTSLDAADDQGDPDQAVNLAAGRFTFLQETRDLGSPADWAQAGASHLWRFHLHYFEWAWSLVAHPDAAWARRTFARLWGSWHAVTRLGRGDPWSPYVASLRAWTLCAAFPALVEGTPIEGAVVADLRRHATYLRINLELDVGGNHLLKNLKALVGLGVFLERPRLLAASTSRLSDQLAIQILDDGGHFERSPSYHCQVLGDLADIAGLLRAAGRPPVPGLENAVARMRRWLGVMLLPSGDVPLFNDCAEVGADRLARLLPGPPAAAGLTVLGASGYAVLRPDDRLHLVADVGQPCPPELPAHAHADCLSFELCVDRMRIIVNSGTSTYERGPRRSYERSTAAHSTVGVDGADQTEVWATFRAARRAGASVHRAEGGETIELVASHDGYRRLAGRVEHRRTWRMAPGTVSVIDEISGAGDHAVVARMYVAPGVPVTEDAGGRVTVGPLDVLTAGPPGTVTAVEDAGVSSRFGPPQEGRRIVAAVTGSLPVTLETVIRLRQSSAATDPAR